MQLLASSRSISTAYGRNRLLKHALHYSTSEIFLLSKYTQNSCVFFFRILHACTMHISQPSTQMHLQWMNNNNKCVIHETEKKEKKTWLWMVLYSLLLSTLSGFCYLSLSTVERLRTLAHTNTRAYARSYDYYWPETGLCNNIVSISSPLLFYSYRV